MRKPTTVVSKPLGGFVFISVRQLCRAWVAYQQRNIRIMDLWVWFAAHELVARRCQVKSGQAVHYTEGELTRLVGGTQNLSHSVRRLAQADLLRWEETQITFPDDRSPMDEAEAVTAMLEQIPNAHRRIPVPRRMIRYIAGGCHKVSLATLAGHLIRCLYYRNGQYCADGHCKARWIAEVFGVSLRQVKHARQMLEDIGLLERHDAPQWVLNSYGPDITINLQWEGPPHDCNQRATKPSADRHSAASLLHCATNDFVSASPESPASAEARCTPSQSSTQVVATNHPTPTEIAPPPSLSNSHIAPPDSYVELSTRTKDQKPACGGAPGVLTALFTKARTAVREGRAPRVEAGPIVQRKVPVPRPQVSRVSLSQPTPETVTDEAQESISECPLSPPTLRHITVQDLRETERLLLLYEQAVNAGLIGPVEADRLTFVALAQHVLAYRPDNAGGLFTQLLRKRQFEYVTQDDEDSAQRRLKHFLYGGAPPVLHLASAAAQRRTG